MGKRGVCSADARIRGAETATGTVRMNCLRVIDDMAGFGLFVPAAGHRIKV
jgi:hypothetical protein